MKLRLFSSLEMVVESWYVHTTSYLDTSLCTSAEGVLLSLSLADTSSVFHESVVTSKQDVFVPTVKGNKKEH